MPTFRVEGADRESGEDVAYDVEAGSEAEARAEVESRMLISDVQPIVLARGRSNGDPHAAPPAVPQSSEPQVHYYVPEERKPRPAPAYIGLQIVSVIAMIYAAVLYVLGLVLLFVAGAALFSLPKMPAPTGSLEVIILIVPALGVLFGGVLVHALSNGCAALRDIAQNSYRL